MLELVKKGRPVAMGVAPAYLRNRYRVLFYTILSVLLVPLDPAEQAVYRRIIHLLELIQLLLGERPGIVGFLQSTRRVKRHSKKKVVA
jgi:hypothetical protein